MNLKLIPPGKFQMGSPEDEKGRAESETLHRVEITKPYYIGVHEVTKGQFAKFVQATGYQTEAEKDGEGGWGWNEAEEKLEGRKPEYTWKSTGFPYEDNHPVVNVSWNDAIAFCARLSKVEGNTYRLLTEAEWEYACRAGTTSAYQPGDDPEALVRYGNTADATAKAKWQQNYHSWSYLNGRDGYVFTAPVGRFQANPFGLCDMHGNVWEWCSDWYEEGYYSQSPSKDPSGPAEGSIRVCRGGSWYGSVRGYSSAFRGRDDPSGRNFFQGFRLALSPSGK